jgi:hypothetical protein
MTGQFLTDKTRKEIQSPSFPKAEQKRVCLQSCSIFLSSQLSSIRQTTVAQNNLETIKKLISSLEGKNKEKENITFRV